MNETIDETFEADVIKSPVPILVCFSSSWCAPCKAMYPDLSELSELIRVMNLNVDENPKSSVAYGVRGVPTLILFKNGEIIAEHAGALFGTRLKSWCDNAIRED